MTDIDHREFYVPASDGKGHSERIWARIQPGYDRQMSVILNSKWFPYRSKGDIIRHALARHLSYLETLAPVPSITTQVDAISEIVREDEFNKEFEDIIKKLQDTVGYYLAQGQTGRAGSLVSRVLHRVELMPESDWKDMYLKAITDRFGNLVSSNPVSLRSLNDEEVQE
jgi:hypothetical protein